MQRLWSRFKCNRFVVLGRVGMDLNADPPGARIETATRFTAGIGGSAGNIAAALARQGVAVELLSCLSDDAVGRFCRAELARYGIGDRHVRSVGGDARSSLALTETVAEGCQTVLYRNGAADFALSREQVEEVDFSGVAALVVTGTALAREPSRAAVWRAMERAKTAGALIVLDVDYRAPTWPSAEEAAQVCRLAAEKCDIVIGNDDEFGLLAAGHDKGRAFAAALARQGALFTVYKMGGQGARTVTPDFEFFTGIFPVAARKPTGAGDGFMGGLLAALARGCTLEDAVRCGAATAALVVSGIGCAAASPDLATLQDFMKRH